MSFSRLPYWLKGGLIAIPVSILVAWATLAMWPLLGGGQNAVWWIAPEYILAAMDLGMRGEPAGFVESATKLAIALVIFCGRMFIVGAIVGAIYGFLAKYRAGAYFLVFLVVAYCVAIAMLAHKTKNPYEVYGKAASIEECESPSHASIDYFNVNDCYEQLAVRTMDATICDKIVPRTEFESEDTKWVCYEEVARVTQDPSLCDAIPRVTLSANGGDTMRHDRCMDMLHECDRLFDVAYKPSCESRKKYAEEQQL